MAQNLSIPLAFACLLHLANEKVGRPGKHGLLQSAYRSFLWDNLSAVTYIVPAFNPED